MPRPRDSSESGFDALVKSGRILACDPKRASICELSATDAATCARLVERATGSNYSARRQRQAVCNALMELLEAQRWLWCFSGAETGRNYPVNLDHQTGGSATIRQSLAFISRALCMDRPISRGRTGRSARAREKVPPENPIFNAMLLDGQRGTCSLRTLLGEKYWASPDGQAYLERLGFDDSILALVPTSRDGAVAFGTGLYLWRKGDVFTPREVALVHHAMGLATVCGKEGRFRWLYPAYVVLDPALRVLVAMLKGGHRRKDIARVEGLSTATVGTQVRDTKAKMLKAADVAHVEGKMPVPPRPKSLKAFVKWLGWGPDAEGEWAEIRETDVHR